MRLTRPSIVAVPLLGLLVALGSIAADSANGLPANWVLTGENSDSYSVAVENETLQLSSEASGGGFGTAMQTIDSAHYVGKTVRFSADVRSSGVEQWAGLWMRVDGNGKVLAFDNMRGRPIKGTTGWKRYDVVLPVDASAKRIAFGILLSGKGNVWMKDLGFEPVAGSVANTAQTASPLPAEPNLNLTP